MSREFPGVDIDAAHVGENGGRRVERRFSEENEMDMKLAGRIFLQGTLRAEHSGKDEHREHVNAVEGRPWIFPGEKIIELDGKLYIVQMPREVSK